MGIKLSNEILSRRGFSSRKWPKFVEQSEKEMGRTYSGIYLLKFDNCVKIGRSAFIPGRMKAYALPHCKKVLKYKFYYLYNHKEAEAMLKTQLGWQASCSEYITHKSFLEIVKIADKVCRKFPKQPKRKAWVCKTNTD